MYFLIHCEETNQQKEDIESINAQLTNEASMVTIKNIQSVTQHSTTKINPILTKYIIEMNKQQTEELTQVGDLGSSKKCICIHYIQ